MSQTHEIDGITLHLSEPDHSDAEWIGQQEILKQMLACWLVVDEKDLPPHSTSRRDAGNR